MKAARLAGNDAGSARRGAGLFAGWMASLRRSSVQPATSGRGPGRAALAVLVGATLCCVAGAASAAQLNVYNWSDYIAKDTIPNFEKQTGITVRYDVYDSDDTLQAKLLTGNSGYDVVAPTSNYAGRQIAAGLFAPLDKSKLPNLKYLDPQLMALVAGADPGNKYAVPWAFGTTGLGYNVDKARKILGPNVALDSWDVLFKPENIGKLKSCGVSVLDAPDQMFAAALHYLGRDPASTKPADYQAAYELLKTIRPAITQFSSSGYINDLVGGDICFTFGWSGDVSIARRRAAEARKPYTIQYFIPKGGAPIWFDVMVIPKDAKNQQEALRWINYIETPQVHAAITNAVYYPSANLEARKYVSPEVAKDPAIYPPPEVLKSLFLLKPMPPDIARLMTRLWTQFKSGR
ncbi:polyamine ABC transporter substrate-binding protein [Chitinasiproducens palmae]|uniref:Putrescine-binding periplasmic protein n=1 Tax=Chitinasiproducens palmae TaxID=1770053 RepID=A0A1H2PTR1_9BURK|nr:polyamine ABC transporter substrate-binding protein [Chitinasiproducens palmae]SDV50494.1 putrescine transport system substrate-binding protein [Chitinasiproducens palmae]